MQATTSKKRFEFGRFGGAVAAAGMAAAFAVGIVTGIAGQAIIDDSTDSTGAAPAVVQPKAYYSAGQGDGLVAGNVATGSVLKAYDAEGMGEGRLAGNAPLAVLPVAHSALGQGEGILGGHTSREALDTPVIDATELTLDREGADVFAPDAGSPDTTGLDLDRDGADIP
jgi:hypothetical protein